MSRYPEGITASQLCTVCDKDKAAISRTVAVLEREGMIQRDAPGGNRYRAKLKLTMLGEKAARQVDQRAKVAVSKAGEDLNDEQRKVLYAVLDMIAGKLQAICADGLEEA